MKHPLNQHAVVIGGSMAGLLTARVLSEHFGRVTLIERDPVHDQAGSPKRPAVNLVTTPDYTRVTGVVVERRATGGSTETLTAGLVVDTTGRGSPTPK